MQNVAAEPFDYAGPVQRTGISGPPLLSMLSMNWHRATLPGGPDAHREVFLRYYQRTRSPEQGRVCSHAQREWRSAVCATQGGP